jgi:hypothetical protein
MILNTPTRRRTYRSRGADLRNQNLSDYHLHFANLKGAGLDKADLSRADLRHCDLTGASLIGTTLGYVNVWDNAAMESFFSSLKTSPLLLQVSISPPVP